MKEKDWTYYRMGDVFPLMFSDIVRRAKAQQNSGGTVIQGSCRQYMSNRLNWMFAWRDLGRLCVTSNESRREEKREQQSFKKWSKNLYLKREKTKEEKNGYIMTKKKYKFFRKGFCPFCEGRLLDHDYQHNMRVYDCNDCGMLFVESFSDDPKILDFVKDHEG